LLPLAPGGEHVAEREEADGVGVAPAAPVRMRSIVPRPRRSTAKSLSAWPGIAGSRAFLVPPWLGLARRPDMVAGRERRGYRPFPPAIDQASG
jgi:hypothetical protein